MQFRFGIYPGGAAGTADGGLATGVPDDRSSIDLALSDLQCVSASPLLVRCYTGFTDDGGPKRTREATAWLLGHHRRNILAPARLGHLPLHITEHGYPTGPGRSAERQAEVLGEVLGVVLEQRHELNIEAYEVFSLRDADSSNPDLFHQFGLMTDSYTPKPAYEVFKHSIGEHCGSA